MPEPGLLALTLAVLLVLAAPGLWYRRARLPAPAAVVLWLRLAVTAAWLGVPLWCGAIWLAPLHGDPHRQSLAAIAILLASALFLFTPVVLLWLWLLVILLRAICPDVER